jgi:hypothetical protein
MILTLNVNYQSLCTMHTFYRMYSSGGGLGSVVGIATGYRLGSPGIESQWGQDVPHLYRPAMGPTQLPVQ